MVAEGGEGENPLGGGWGEGGGGVGGVSRLRFPPGPHLRSSRFSRRPRPRQAPTTRFAKNRNLRGLGGFCGPRPLVGRAPSPGGPGPKPPGDLAHRPLGPGSRHSHRLTSCNRLKPMGPGLKTLGCYHNPQSADLGGRWMVSEGGALQSHERRGSRLCSSISAAEPGPKFLGTWPTSP